MWVDPSKKQCAGLPSNIGRVQLGAVLSPLLLHLVEILRDEAFGVKAVLRIVGALEVVRQFVRKRHEPISQSLAFSICQIEAHAWLVHLEEVAQIGKHCAALVEGNDASRFVVEHVNGLRGQIEDASDVEQDEAKGGDGVHISGNDGTAGGAIYGGIEKEWDASKRVGGKDEIRRRRGVAVCRRFLDLARCGLVEDIG